VLLRCRVQTAACMHVGVCNKISPMQVCNVFISLAASEMEPVEDGQCGKRNKGDAGGSGGDLYKPGPKK
jgi:hypothetical protein